MLAATCPARFPARPLTPDPIFLPPCRQRMGAALKTTCLAFEEQFVAAAVAPQLAAAAGLPNWLPNSTHADSAALRERLAAAGLLEPPAAPAAQLAGMACALPLLLSAVLPYAGNRALCACLRRLCTDGGSGSGEVWALQHPRPLVAAVRCAVEVASVQVSPKNGRFARAQC